MRGVYVLDLESDYYFVLSGNSITEVSREMELMKISKKYDGSFHFYPIQQNETDYDAEKRIYWMMINKQGIQTIYARKELMESIGKGTWTPNMVLKKMIRNESSTSIQASSAEKELFQMSI